MFDDMYNGYKGEWRDEPVSGLPEPVGYYKIRVFVVRGKGARVRKIAFQAFAGAVSLGVSTKLAESIITVAREAESKKPAMGSASGGKGVGFK